MRLIKIVKIIVIIYLQAINNSEPPSVQVITTGTWNQQDKLPAKFYFFLSVKFYFSKCRSNTPRFFLYEQTIASNTLEF